MENAGTFEQLPEIRVQEMASPYSMGSFTECTDALVLSLVRRDEEKNEIINEEVLLKKDDSRLIIGRTTMFPRGMAVCYETSAEIHGGLLGDTEIATGYIYYVNN